jgi:glycosyltransferase involved in cell wall biosynthesis
MGAVRDDPTSVMTPPAPRPEPSRTVAQSTSAMVPVAYLVNQYPKVSHSFIRREIEGLEAVGFPVERISLRPSPDELVDEADRREQRITRVVLAGSKAGLLRAALAVALRWPGRWLRTLRTAWRLGQRSDRGRLRHLAYFVEACVCRQWLARSGARHVHAHFGTNAATVAMLCRELGGPPFSFTVHGPEEFDKPEFLALREKIERAAFTVAITDFCRSQLYRWARHEDWSRIVVVHCGLDRLFLQEPPAPIPSARRLVCVGRLCEQKGQIMLVEAAAALHREGCAFELVLVGDGPMRAAIEALIAREGLQDSVRITGWRSSEAVRAELNAARALVLPSFGEGLPVVIMEALALGRPVISTCIAAIPELVRDGETGWLVPASNSRALEAAMRAALEAPLERLERLGSNGRDLVVERHDAAREAERLAAHIVAAQRGGTP